MIKKIFLLSMMVIFISTSMCMAPVAASTLPDNIATDYVAGEVTGNVLGDTLSAGYNYNHINLMLEGETGLKSDVNFSSTSDGYKITSNRVLPDPHASYSKNEETGYHEWDGVTRNYSHPFSGGFISIASWGNHQGQYANVVFEFKLKTLEGYKAPVFNVGRTSRSLAADNPNRMEYPAEYNQMDKGITPDGASEWTSFRGTFEDNGQKVENYSYGMGLAKGTPQNAGVVISNDAYMGVEYLYDIKVSADRTGILPGEEFYVDADIINQLGMTDNFSQEVTWYALNESRTATANGFTITDGTDGTATVSTSESLLPGTYYIVAVADLDADFVKGIKIEVAPFDMQDYVAGEITGNVVAEKLTAGYNYNHINLKLEGETSVKSDVWFGYNSEEKLYAITSYRELPDPHASFAVNEETGYHEWDGTSYVYNYPFSGGYISGIDWGEDANKTENMVFSFKVKGTENSKINFGRANNSLAASNSKKIEYPAEYSEKTSGFVPNGGDEWETFSGTVKNNGYAVSKYALGFGLAQGTAKGAAAYISEEDAYIGIEYLYDMRISSDKTMTVAGGALTVNADIVNQVGRESDFSQDVTWFVMNEDKTETIPGAKVAENVDGSARIQMPETVSEGNYKVVAVSKDYPELIKSFNFMIIAGEFGDHIPEAVAGNSLSIEGNNKTPFLAPTYTPFDLTAITTTYAGTDEESWTLDTLEDIGVGIVQENGRGAAGASIPSQYYSAEEILKPGKNIVIGANVKAQRGTPIIQAAMFQYSKEPLLPIEHPEGMKLENSEWVPFAATIHIPEDGFMGVVNTSINIGYAYTGLVDECRRILLIQKDSLYVGEEYAYDIEVSANTGICTQGETNSFTVNSKIINQLGSTGYLDQNVTWHALDEDRLSHVDGISITENPDGTATVTVSDTVSEGVYDIVAVSDNYEGIQKGITIKVTNPFAEYVPGAVTGNFFDGSTENLLFVTWNPSDFNTLGTINAGTDDEAWTVRTSMDIDRSVYRISGPGVAGAGLSSGAYNAAKNLSAGKNVVVGAKVKSTAGTPVIKTGMYHLQSYPILPVEYPEVLGGFPVSGSEWQDFGATIKIPETEWRGYEHTIFYLGFAYTGKTSEGTRGFAVKKNSLYMGEEYAYDIKASANKTIWTQGQTLSMTLNADIINQVGTEGYLNQNVTWHALDITRTKHVEGIEITENSDGTATLTVGSTVPAGSYDIVAMSDAYEGFVRGIRIKVVGTSTPQERVTVFNLKEANGTATLAAAVEDVVSEEIFFAIVCYDENDKMVDLTIDTKKPTDGIVTITGMTHSGIASGMKVKAFIWNNKTLKPIPFAEKTEHTTIVKE